MDEYEGLHRKPPAESAPPFVFDPDHTNFWESYMIGLIEGTNSLIFMDENKNFIIRGDGVRLHMPYDWIFLCPPDDLCIYIINGIHVSQARRSELGY